VSGVANDKKKKMRPAYWRAILYGALFVIITAYLIWKGGC
jgi:hypothetical protein